MAFELTVFNAVLILAAVLTTAVAALAWRNRQKTSSLALSALMLAALGWILRDLVGNALEGNLSLVWHQYMFVAIPITVMAYLVFGLLYTGREEYVRPKYLAAMALHPALVLVFTATNDMHGLFWGNFDAANASAWTIEPLWIAHGAYSYLAMGATTALIFRELLTRDDAYRGQAIAIGVAVIVPWVANAAFLGLSIPVDITPAGFAVTGVALLWGMTSYGLGDVAPVARRTLLDNFRDGLIVVDTDDRIIEINDEAKRMFGLDPDREFIGEPMAAVFDHMPGFYETYGGLEEAREDVDVDLKERRTFDVQVSPLRDSRDQLVGRLFLVHDITEQKRRERELELQNRQLDQFASLVTHEIQDPLADVRDRVDATLDSVSTEDRGQLLHAQRSLDEIDELVDDMLAMARQGSVVDREETKVVNLRDAADRAWWDLTEDRMPQRVSVADQDVRADPDRLDRMLINLFENAIKYAGADATIRVDVLEGADGKVGFYVEDDGPGIPKSARESVFQAGVSGSDSSAGLGLAIVRTMAEAHDWEVSVTDGDLGGARVTVTGVEFPEERIREVDASFEPASPTDD